MKNLLQRKSIFLCLMCMFVFGVCFGITAHAEGSSVNIRHMHAGTKDDGGGCYTKKNTGSKEQWCGNYSNSGPFTNGSETWWKGVCQGCGHEYTSENPTGTHTKWVSYTYYTTECGIEDDEIQGSLVLTPSTTEWTKELILTATYEVTDNVSVNENAYIWNSQAAISESTYDVRENEVYTCMLNLDSEDAVSETASLTIRNIDYTAPTIYEVAMSDDSGVLTDVMTATVLTEDLQPDGTQGCGLHEQAYSWDEGETWIAENTYTIDHNGTYTVWVRDALENYTVTEMTVSNLDTYGPKVTYYLSPDTWTNGSVTVTVKAVDVQPEDMLGGGENGTQGIGLAAKAYSWDEGKTWGTTRSYETSSNISRIVWVRDKFNNITKCKTVVDNIDTEPPVISLEADSGSKQDIENILLTASAYDAVSGLAYRPYSWDYGGNWVREQTYTVNQDGTYTVYARDNAGNMSWKKITIEVEEKTEEETQPVVPPEETPKPKPGNQPSTPKPKPIPASTKETVKTETETKTEETAAEQETLSSKKSTGNSAAQNSPSNNNQRKQGQGIFEKIAAIILGTGTGCFLFFCFLYVFCSVEVQGLDIEGKYIVLGRRIIRKKKQSYFITIPQRILDKSDVNRYKLVFGSYFAKQNNEKELLIRTDGKEKYVLIRKEVDFTV